MLALARTTSTLAFPVYFPSNNIQYLLCYNLNVFQFNLVQCFFIWETQNVLNPLTVTQCTHDTINNSA